MNDQSEFGYGNQEDQSSSANTTAETDYTLYNIEQTKTFVEVCVEKWIRRMELDRWRYDIQFAKIKQSMVEEILMGDYLCRGFEAGAVTNVQWQYMHFKITFDLNILVGHTLHEIESCVVHELCHVLVSPIQVGDDNEEYAVTMLARAFMNTQDEGVKKVGAVYRKLHKAKKKLKKCGRIVITPEGVLMNFVNENPPEQKIRIFNKDGVEISNLETGVDDFPAVYESSHDFEQQGGDA